MNRWTKAVVLITVAAASFVLGYLARRNDWVPRSMREAARAPLTSWHADKVRDGRPFQGDAFPLQNRRESLDAETRDALGALGYAQAAKPATSQSGVTEYDPEAAFNGLNLYTSGHAPEAILMDMNGNALHTWRRTLDEALPGYVRPSHVRDAARASWRRAYLYSNGNLLAIFEGMALIKLDKDSNVLWTYAAGCHHDLGIVPGGGVYVLTSEAHDGIIDNGIALLDDSGKELRRVSILDCFRASPYASLLQWMPVQGDVLHVNAVKLLDGSHDASNPAFAAGNLLISVLTLNTIAVVDFDHQTIPWAISGLTKAQHEPTLLSSGNLLVFDNQGAGDHSRVLEIDPQTQAIVWQHPAPAGPDFYSEWCGSAQRLANGNTLITETDNGRAFEVAPDHRIVWEFINPNQFDEKGVRMVAALFDVVRLDSNQTGPWISGSGEK